MTLPFDFSARTVAAAIGPEQRVRTIDVTTQQPGPRLTLGVQRFRKQAVTSLEVIGQ